MGLDYIMADEGPPGLTVDVECRTTATVWPNPLYVAYCKALIEAYGSCLRLAGGS